MTARHTTTRPDEIESLLDAIRAARTGQGDPTALLAAFRRATVYGERPPGSAYAAALIATLPEDAPLASGTHWVRLYTSAEALARVTGRRVAWWATTGADIADHVLPALATACGGPIGVALDIGSDHEMALPPVPPMLSHEVAHRMATLAPQDRAGDRP